MFKKQAFRFIIVGLLSVCVDTIIYFLTKSIVSPSLAKGISFVSGTLVAYLLNKQWTFEEDRHHTVKVIKFVSLYTFTLFANISVNRLGLHLYPGAYILSFIAATGTSTVLNFIGQKWWVFKK
jgi:putative flippase GtrA